MVEMIPCKEDLEKTEYRGEAETTYYTEALTRISLEVMTELTKYLAKVEMICCSVIMETDVIIGGSGNDEIHGEGCVGGCDTGNDQLKGEDGDDTLSGGAGKDSFVCGSGNDKIIDFNPSEDIKTSDCETF